MPAAPVGDMHVCPMATVLVPHVGGPMLPSSTLTVLIGGQPSARMTSLATHGGTVVLGYPTVLVDG
jgi:uncharacterized Zn-binding protein involved in type VI secretion